MGSTSSKNELLKRLEDLRHAGADLAETRRRLVAEARAAGLSWRRIGLVLGISRQAAWEHYNEQTPSLSIAEENGCQGEP